MGAVDDCGDGVVVGAGGGLDVEDVAGDGPRVKGAQQRVGYVDVIEAFVAGIGGERGDADGSHVACGRVCELECVADVGCAVIETVLRGGAEVGTHDDEVRVRRDLLVHRAALEVRRAERDGRGSVVDQGWGDANEGDVAERLRAGGEEMGVERAGACDSGNAG